MKQRINRLTSLLGICYPVILGGMAHLGRHALAAAVSNAGGLGQLGCTGLTDDDALREEIKKTRVLTDAPFAVNVPMGSSFSTFQRRVELLLNEGIKIVTLGGGNPAKGIPYLKENGLTVMTVVGCARHAVKAVEVGADLLVAEGIEAGGHDNNDEITTMILTRSVADAVRIPVIAAGGISDGRSMAAAFCLGASGVQMGTRFLMSEESVAHENLKQALLRATDRDTYIIGRAEKMLARTLRTPLSERYLEQERNGTFQFADVMREFGRDFTKVASVEGDLEHGLFMPGQDIGLIDNILPVRSIMDEMIKEAEEILSLSFKEAV